MSTSPHRDPALLQKGVEKLEKYKFMKISQNFVDTYI